MDIAEAARLSGLPPSTLRFYEAKGLIRSTGRRGLRRQYDPAVVERLALVTLGRAAGFSLHELAALFGAPLSGAAGPLRLDRQLLAAKAAELDRRIRQLTALRNGLRHAAECSAPSHLECPKFRRLLRAAVARARKSS